MRYKIICAAVLATTLVAFGQKTNSPELTLGAALHQEEVEGNCNEAIMTYSKLIQDKGTPANIAARSQLHLGICREKLGQREARTAYEAVVARYADQTEMVAEARRHLAALEGIRSSDTPSVRHVFAADEFPASITSDGRFMGIADSDRSGIGVRDVASGQIKWLVDGDDANTEVGCTILSPDQRQVVYAWYGVNSEVRLIANQVGSKPRILIPGKEEYDYVDPLAWAPDGKSILIVIRKRDQTWQLGWVSVADGTIKVLKSLEWRFPERASLSPDGRYIAYATVVNNPSHPMRPEDHSLDSTGVRIYVLAADGSTETALTKDAGINSSPIWTPDGGHILFISDRYGNRDLWSVPVQGGKAAGPASLVKRNFAGWPIGMTRSGSYYYGEDAGSGGEQTSVVDMQPDGARLRNSAPAREPLIGLGPSWSPDGKFIALQRARGKSTSFLGRQSEMIRVVHSVETGEEKIYSHAGIVLGSARWLSDSTGFLETIENENGTHSIYRVDVKTGEFKPVLTFDRSPNHSTIGQLSPDDKTLYVQSLDSILAFDLTNGSQKTIFTLPGTGTLAGFALSDDGRKLALRIGDRNGATRTIASVSIDGSDYRELYSGHDVQKSLAWMKDGGGILFVAFDSSYKVMRISKDGGKPELTGLERSFPIYVLSLNKDGSRLAFNAGDTTGGWEVFSLDNVMPALKTAK